MGDQTIFRNATYSFYSLSDEEKDQFTESIKRDYNKLFKIQSDRSGNTGYLYEDAFKYNKVDENRLEELANVYAEIKTSDKKLAERVRMLAWLIVINSGEYFVNQKSVRNFHLKYPSDCSLDEMWLVFARCFDDFDPKRETQGNDGNEKVVDRNSDNETSDSNRFIAYFKSRLFYRFLNIYNNLEKKIVKAIKADEKTGESEKEYYSILSLNEQRSDEDGEQWLFRIEDPADHISTIDYIVTQVYNFSNLITNIMDHLGGDQRKSNESIKRMFKAFYTGDTIAFAKCEGLNCFYNEMCGRERKIINSCLKDFFAFILSDEAPETINQIRLARIKTYGEINSGVFKNKDLNETPVLYMPTETNNNKRFGFENLVYAAFSNTSTGNISNHIKKYDDFRNKYFFNKTE